MSKRMVALAVALAVAVAAASVGCAGPPPAPAESPAGDAAQSDGAQDQGGGQVTVDDFTAPLSNYGTWSDDPSYGRVWQPSPDVVGQDFTPYASGVRFGRRLGHER